MASAAGTDVDWIKAMFFNNTGRELSSGCQQHTGYNNSTGTPVATAYVTNCFCGMDPSLTGTFEVPRQCITSDGASNIQSTSQGFYVISASKAPTGDHPSITYKCVYTPTAEDLAGGVYLHDGSSLRQITSLEPITITLTNSGCAILGASILPDIGYLIAPTSYFVNSPLAKLTTDESFSVGFTTNSDGAISYDSSNNNVASVDSSGMIVIKGTGKTTITASTPQTATYLADSKSVELTVSKATQTLSLTTPITTVYNSAPFNLGINLS